jgi:hypothetical protein
MIIRRFNTPGVCPAPVNILAPFARALLTEGALDNDCVLRSNMTCAGPHPLSPRFLRPFLNGLGACAALTHSCPRMASENARNCSLMRSRCQNAAGVSWVRAATSPGVVAYSSGRSTEPMFHAHGSAQE